MKTAHRHLPAQIGIVAAFALLPLWLRLPQSPIFAPLYVTRFALLLPLLWTIGAWLLAGAPGLGRLRRADGAGGRWRRAWALALLALALWAALSTEWAFIRARFPDVALSAALQFGVVALFAVAVACVGTSRLVLIGLLIGLAYSAPIVIAQAVGQSWLGLTLLGEFPITSDSGASILRAGSLTYIRPYGLLPHPNTTGGALLVGTLAAGALLFARQRWLRAAGVLVIAVGFAALLLTFSRSAWVGLGAGGVVALLLLLRRLGERPGAVLAAGGLALVVLVGFAAAYRPFVLARAGIGEEPVELRSVADRIVFTDFALRSIRERPLLGVGIGNFPWRTSYYLVETFYDLRGDNVHHVYLSAWAELGIVGLALLLVALICGAVGALTQRPLEVERAALLAVAAALAVVGWFDHYPWTLLHFQVAWWGCLAGAVSGGMGDHAPKTEATLTSPSD